MRSAREKCPHHPVYRLGPFTPPRPGVVTHTEIHLCPDCNMQCEVEFIELRSAKLEDEEFLEFSVGWKVLQARNID